jgi:WD40 repeat protein
VDAAVARALSKLPVDRQPSVAGFVEALSAPATPGRAAEPLRHPSSRRPAVLLLGGLVGLTALALGAVAILRRPAERVVQPDRVQLTFSGNARTPALSADGRRLAYSARQCDTLGHCTTDVILQDLGGAGASTLLRDWGSVQNIEWTADGRYLLVNGFEGAGRDWGLFAVPILGGAPRHLIRGNGWLIGATDTVLAVRPIVGDSVSWLRWITIADGVTRDSLALPPELDAWFNFRPFADGRKLILVRDGGGGWTATIMDRSGQPLDSLSVTEPGVSLVGPTPDGRAILARAVAAFDQSRDDFSLLAWRLRQDGRVEGGPDTVLRGLSGGARVAPDGSLLLEEGPRRFEVWALERAGSTTMDFAERMLIQATGVLNGDLSPAGDRVLLRRTSRENDRTVNRYSLMPFEGGEEAPFDLPPGAFGAGWHRSGTSLLAFSRPSGDVRSPLGVPFRRVIGRGVQPISGGFLVPVRDPMGIWRVGAPGQPDTTFGMGDRWAGVHGIDVSPDGRSVVWVGWDRRGDSVLVERVSLADGSVRRLAAFYPHDGGPPYWLSDGTILVGVEETAASLGWYRIREDGGPPERLGSPPRFPAVYSLSRDGRRVVATVAEDSPDIYLIRNFALLLRH